LRGRNVDDYFDVKRWREEMERHEKKLGSLLLSFLLVIPIALYSSPCSL
tara:strand:- start:437 stop:583 length:147 start_codon:yes stop_codon:yes gene_type:complete